MSKELKDMLDRIGDSFKAFREKYDGELATLRSHVRELETVNARIAPNGGGGGTAEAKKVLQAYDAFMRRGDLEALRALEPQNGMSIGVGPDGGFLVHPEVEKGITRHMRDTSPLWQLAHVKQIQSLSYQMMQGSGSGTTSGFVGEVEERPETEIAELRVIEVTARECYANIPVSQNLIDDVGSDVTDYVIGETGDEFARQFGASFVSGNGVKRPRGFTTLPTSAAPDSSRPFGTIQYTPSGNASGFATASATVSPADALIDLVHSLRAVYRREAAFLMNTATLAMVRKFKDIDGNLLVRPGLEAGAPTTLLGYPVYEDEEMPAVAAGAFPIAFGNWRRGYLIVDRITRMLRDPFTRKPWVLFYSTKRVGGDVRNTEAIKLLKIATS